MSLPLHKKNKCKFQPVRLDQNQTQWKMKISWFMAGFYLHIGCRDAFWVALPSVLMGCLSQAQEVTDWQWWDVNSSGLLVPLCYLQNTNYIIFFMVECGRWIDGSEERRCSIILWYNLVILPYRLSDSMWTACGWGGYCISASFGLCADSSPNV